MHFFVTCAVSLHTNAVLLHRKSQINYGNKTNKGL